MAEHLAQKHPPMKPTQADIDYWAKIKSLNQPKERAEYTEAEVKNALIRRAETLIRIKKKDGVFVLDETAKWLMNLLFLYFTRNPLFELEGEGYSLDKGLLLMGGVGVGKTSSLQIFADIPGKAHHHPISNFNDLLQMGWNDGIFFGSGIKLGRIVSCKELAINFSMEDGGWSTIEPYLKNKQTFVYDDLGAEEIPAYHFKQAGYVMEEILTKAEINYSQYAIITHATTNIIARSRFDELYGQRMVSRVRGMFNQVYVDGEDRR